MIAERIGVPHAAAQGVLRSASDDRGDEEAVYYSKKAPDLAAWRLM
jgi:hypothetical protein